MRKHHYKLQGKEELQLNITTFLNLMVVLVPFLLITAVFSRMAVIELNLPSAADGPAAAEIGFRPEVIVRELGLEITNGREIIASMPKVDGEYDIATLAQYMRSLKEDYSEVDAASVLVEPQIPYDYLIRVMDVVRSADIPDETAENGFVRVALFPAIAVGEAP
jgi:biopolymer transport protein ExbD